MGYQHIPCDIYLATAGRREESKGAPCEEHGTTPLREVPVEVQVMFPRCQGVAGARYVVVMERDSFPAKPRDVGYLDC